MLGFRMVEGVGSGVFASVAVAPIIHTRFLGIPIANLYLHPWTLQAGIWGVGAFYGWTGLIDVYGVCNYG